MKIEKKPIEYYLKLGMDYKTAEYFHNGRKKLLGVTPREDFTLLLEFEDNDKRIFDMKSLLEAGTVFEPFMVYENFKRVYLDENNCVAWDINPNIDSSVVWNNKVDLSSDSCYINSIAYT